MIFLGQEDLVPALLAFEFDTRWVDRTTSLSEWKHKISRKFLIPRGSNKISTKSRNGKKSQKQIN